MKRTIAAGVLLCVLTGYVCGASAEYEVSLTPKETFVGDETEIRCTVTGIPVLVSGTDGQPAVFEFSGGIAAWDTQEEVCTVRHVTVSFYRDSCTVTVRCVPWQPGMLDFPPFSLAPFGDGLSGISMDIPPVFISSVLEKTGADSLQPPAPPLVVPGTTYIIYAVVIGCVLLCAALIVLAVKFSRIRPAVARLWRQVFCSKSYRRAVKQLRRLEKQSAGMEDRPYAAALSHIVRTYLENRFNLPFSAAAVPEIASLFQKAYAGTMNSALSEAAGTVSALCFRFDFIRFSTDPDTARFPQEERRQLAADIRGCLRIFENPAREDASDRNA